MTEDRAAPRTEAAEEPDGLYQRAQTRGTPLLAKLADLSDAEWDELTHRMRKHFERELTRRDMVIVPRAAAALAPEIDVERLAKAMYPGDAGQTRGDEIRDATEVAAAYQRLTPPGDRDPAAARWMECPDCDFAVEYGEGRTMALHRSEDHPAGDRDRREARLVEAGMTALRGYHMAAHEEHRHDVESCPDPRFARLVTLLAAPGQAGPPESGGE